MGAPPPIYYQCNGNGVKTLFKSSKKSIDNYIHNAEGKSNSIHSKIIIFVVGHDSVSLSLSIYTVQVAIYPTNLNK